MASRKTTYCWKFCQLLFYLLAFVAGVVASVTFAYVVQNFDGRCPLYTELNCTLRDTSNSTGEYVVLGADLVELWRKKSTCDFSTFVPMSGAAIAFILAYFVLMFDTVHQVSKTGSFHNRMIGLFLPLLLTSLVLSILMLVSSIGTLKGTNTFCDSIFQSLSVSCQDAQFYHWEGFPLAENFYNLLLTSVITTWISTGAYMLSVILLFVRCGCGVDYSPIAVKKSKLAYDENVVPHKPRLRKDRLRQDSTQPLLQSESSVSEFSQAPPPSSHLEPQPGTSASEPQLVFQPASSSPQLTVAT